MFAATLLLAAAIGWCLASPGVAAERIEFENQLEFARASVEEPRPAVVVFSAPWCGWCRKLAATTMTDPAIVELREQFLWIKIDPEEEPELAARHQVYGLPHLVILDAADRPLVSRPGYIPPATLRALLDDVLAGRLQPRTVEESAGSLSETTSADWSARVRAAVERIALADAPDRLQVTEELQRVSEAASPILLDLLSDERLAVRAAAGSLLSQWTNDPLPFDPFADPVVRDQQVTAWRERLGITALPATSAQPESVPDESETLADEESAASDVPAVNSGPTVPMTGEPVPTDAEAGALPDRENAAAVSTSEADAAPAADSATAVDSSPAATDGD